ncbi:hypothetical protein DFH07DRAFT_842258 [Mycena maculata]|uniref:Uncharacterized protein n=1 Tax=Mycena maculata TaxID=230809 RepID=A0AAD7MXE8_9AGAR|nr:hypothetical protein DFH07DRAFT_842258 [Mycena maculata]
MPIYTLTTRSADRSKMKSFVKALTALHAETFHSDPAAVRVEFVIAPYENTLFRYGGYGLKPGKGLFGYDKTTAHLVAQVVWNGSMVEWQEYCTKIVNLWGPQLRTIVLQRVEWEFEVVEEGRQGRVVVNGLEGGET